MWNSFSLLSQRRDKYTALPIADLEAWARIHAVEDVALFVRQIVQLDVTWLRTHNKEAPK